MTDQIDPRLCLSLQDIFDYIDKGIHEPGEAYVFQSKLMAIIESNANSFYYSAEDLKKLYDHINSLHKAQPLRKLLEQFAVKVDPMAGAQNLPSNFTLRLKEYKEKKYISLYLQLIKEITALVHTLGWYPAANTYSFFYHEFTQLQQQKNALAEHPCWVELFSSLRLAFYTHGFAAQFPVFKAGLFKFPELEENEKIDPEDYIRALEERLILVKTRLNLLEPEPQEVDTSIVQEAFDEFGDLPLETALDHYKAYSHGGGTLIVAKGEEDA
jgi:hypothetical protein